MKRLRYTFLLLLMGAVAHGAEPDQLQPLISGFTSLHRDYACGQLFKPQVTALEEVKLYLATSMERGSAPVTLVVRRGGFDGPVIGQATLSGEEISKRGGWHSFRLSPALRLEPGRTYCLRLSCDVPEKERVILPAATDYFLDLYPDGSLVTQWKSDRPQLRPGTHLAFKTYPGPTGGGEPGKGGDSVENLAGGFKKLLNLDYSDNFVFAGANSYGGKDPREEIAEAMRLAKSEGFDGVNFRVAFMGEALFPSRVASPVGARFGGKAYSWVNRDEAMAALIRAVNTIDPLAVAIEEAHRNGLQLYAWVTINDEGITQERLDRFLEQHPHYQWVNRAGDKYLSGVPCFGEPEMRAYTLRRLRELMEYGVDGLYVSTRGHTTAFRLPTLMEFGFNQPFADAFRQKFGVDLLKHFDEKRDGERLISLRAEIELALYRELRIMRDRDFPGVRLLFDLSVYPQDYPAWVREGLVDEIAVHTVSGSEGALPEAGEYRDLGIFYRRRFAALGEVDVLMWLQIYSYRHQYQQEREEITDNLRAIRASGVDGVIFHEHCAILSEPDQFVHYIREGFGEVR